MPIRLLVLHGPNLNLVSDRGRPLEALDAMLTARAVALGVELRIVQSNHEGALVDALHEERELAQGLLVNPGALAPHADVLAEAIRLVGLPTVEVLLETAGRKGSALRQDVELQVAGKGFEGYLQALDWLGQRLGAKKVARAEAAAMDKARGPRAAPPPKALAVEPAKALAVKAAPAVDLPAASPSAAAKSIGAKGASEVQVAAPALVVGKTIGRKSAPDKSEKPGAAGKKTLGARVEKSPSAADGALTRAAVRAKIAERLSGSLSPSGLATWARGQWQQLQRGAPVESGQRDRLEDVLQSLLLSAASKANDHQLIELMTQLSS